MLCEHQRFFKPLMTLIFLILRPRSKKSVQSVRSEVQKIQKRIALRASQLILIEPLMTLITLMPNGTHVLTPMRSKNQLNRDYQ